MKKAKVGRKTVMTSIVLGKLEYAFAIGCSDREASQYANINPDTLYKYQKENPEFSERKQQLKSRVILMARKKVYDAVSTDVKFAKWLLERLRPEEFGSRHRRLAVVPEAKPSEEESQRVLEILKQLGEDDL